jgi:hypothetical protein
LQPFQFQPVGVNVRKVLLGLLDKPAFRLPGNSTMFGHGAARVVGFVKAFEPLMAYRPSHREA